MGPFGKIGGFGFCGGVFVGGTFFALGGNVVEVDVVAVRVVGGGFGGWLLRVESVRLQGCFVGLGWVRWWVGVVGEGDLAVLIFGDIGMVAWAENLILMGVLLVGLIGCC